MCFLAVSHRYDMMMSFSSFILIFDGFSIFRWFGHHRFKMLTFLSSFHLTFFCMQPTPNKLYSNQKIAILPLQYTMSIFKRKWEKVIFWWWRWHFFYKDPFWSILGVISCVESNIERSPKPNHMEIREWAHFAILPWQKEEWISGHKFWPYPPSNRNIILYDDHYIA